ncbi:MAG: four helix bundle protein [Xanthomonadales bacterium]|nr:four helix bundle protein [Xanthomonadales bacterium]
MSKLTISYKEARETHYWLRLLKDTGYMNTSQYEPLAKDCEEILRILYSIIRSSKQNQ